MDKKPFNRFEYRYSPQHLEVIDLLLMSLKTDINDKIYSGGLTVLMIWTLNGNLQIVERLLQHPDIDTTIKTKKGHTAAELVNDQRDDIKQLFQAHEEKLAETSSSSSRPPF